MYEGAVQDLIDELGRLPGVGPKSAQRIAFHLLAAESADVERLAATLIRIPPHSDFEQGTGHTHDEIEELYLVTRGTLTMRFGDDVRKVSAPAAVRVAAATPRSHRNEGDEPVDLWAISPRSDGDGGNKIDDFWEASDQAAQRR